MLQQYTKAVVPSGNCRMVDGMQLMNGNKRAIGLFIIYAVVRSISSPQTKFSNCEKKQTIFEIKIN